MAGNDTRISAAELSLARKMMDLSLRAGAQKARIVLSKSLMDLVATLNGEVDKISRCLDRSLSLTLYVDGRVGTVSTNRLTLPEEGGAEADFELSDDMKDLVAKAIEMTRLLQEDPCKALPDPTRTATGAVSGTELELFDEGYFVMTARRRREIALSASRFGKVPSSTRLISEEGEYSDSISDSVTLNSDGLFCRHTETSFEYGSSVTVEDADGNKYSGTWWDSAPKLDALRPGSCTEEALRRALAQIGPKGIRTGKYTMVVENECARKLFKPLLKALGGASIQQKNSFLADAMGRKAFPDQMTVTDCPLEKGRPGARLFDSEGVATKDSVIIDHGTVRQFFISTYISNKTGLAPTIDSPSRPKLLPTMDGGLQEVLRLCSDGILVTGFNGGNSNSSTGSFSFGVEGFVFRDGKVAEPFSEAVITGNLLTLWNSLIAAGSDYRPCSATLVPTVAFRDVDFSG